MPMAAIPAAVAAEDPSGRSCTPCGPPGPPDGPETPGGICE